MNGLWAMVALLGVALVAGCSEKGSRRQAASVEEPAMKSIAGKNVLLVFASKDFRDEELRVPEAAFKKAGGRVTLASSTLSEATGMLGGKARADILLTAARAGDYDALVFVGGAGATEYFDSPTAHGLAREAARQGKVVAAICVAPSILANAGLLKDRKATCFETQADNLKAKGATYTGQGVTVDGKLITAEGPGRAQEFAEAVIDALVK
jgi:protease I